MKIEQSYVTKLRITDVAGWDPISVLLQDYGEGRGQLIVECYGQSWASFWSAMGGTLTRFIKDVSADYIASRMFLGQRQIIDPDVLQNQLKREVLKLRFSREMSHQDAYDLMYKIETSDFDAPFHLDSGMMVTLIGDDWHVALPYTDAPAFTRLVKLIEIVKQAIQTYYPHA